MIKNKEWLKEEVLKLQPDHIETYQFPDYLTVLKTEMTNEFIELIDQLEEPEKVVIPQFVADWIEEHKDKFNLRGALGVFNGNDLVKDYYNQKVYDWLRYTKEDGEIVWNDETFALAWINGYEIEKEKLYYIKKYCKINYLYFSKIDVYRDGDYNYHSSSSKRTAFKFPKEQAQALANFVGGEIEEVIE